MKKRSGRRRRNVADDSSYSDAIDLIYASILDDQHLDNAFKAVVDLTEASGVGHFEYDTGTGALLRSETVGIDPQTLREYTANYSRQDIRLPAALNVPVGTIFTGHRIVDERVFRASEVYDFLSRRHIPHIMAVVASKMRSSVSVFSLQRTGQQGRFLADAEQRFSPVLPHLLRALRIRDALSAARTAHTAMMDVLGRLPIGIVLLDRDGRTISLSAAAEQLVRRSTGLAYTDNQVRAVHPDDDRRLQRAIHRAATTEGALPVGATLLIRAIDGTSLTITVIPVRDAQGISASHRPTCMLVVHSENRGPLTRPEIVMTALRLTYAEATLACTLSAGLSLREAAAKLNVSINTCKTQLKSIYQKTGWRNHVDLTKALVVAALSATGNG